jgi:hypothetical protein
MKTLAIFALTVLFLLPLAAAEENGLMSDISGFLTDSSPVVLLVLGAILMVVPSLAKLIGIVLVAFGIVRIIMMLVAG